MVVKMSYEEHSAQRICAPGEILSYFETEAPSNYTVVYTYRDFKPKYEASCGFEKMNYQDSKDLTVISVYSLCASKRTILKQF